MAMHDVLFGDPGKLGQSRLIEYAKALKLDVPAFRSCLESGKHKPGIQNDMQVAASLQINGTPSFLVGKAICEDVSGTIIVGAQPFSAFEEVLKAAESGH